MLCQDTSAAFHTRLFAPLFLRAGRFADRILADSTQTKADIIAHLGIAENKITVVNLGVADKFAPMPKEPREHYVVGYVGSLSRRKRLDHLLRAFYLLKERLTETPVRLVICGSKRLEYPALVKLATEHDISRDVEFRGFVTEETLVETYNSFDVFVLPSEWEGFGLPILEAQKCGVPVVIRKGTHIPSEVSAACLQAESETDIADKIQRLFTDSDFRSTVIREGLEHSKQFTWEKTVRQVLAIYEEQLL
jgi:glycosyltransferase involved in cell wall biosynthesis